MEKCSVCGCLENQSPKFYYNSQYGKNICNKHYLQLRRHGRVFDDIPHFELENQCDVCDDKGKLKICYLEGYFYSKTLCVKHYQQVYYHGCLLDNFPSHKNKERICEVCDSDNDVHYYRKTNQMLCRRHYTQLITYNKILDITIFDRNKYEFKADQFGQYVEIILRNVNHEETARTMIDVDDFDRVIKYKWRYEKTWKYISTGNSKDKTYIMLQNFILNQKGMIDHIDRNTLNNRKYNLMLSNKSLNALNAGIRSNNTSGITGVSFNKNSQLWRIYINWEGERIELGYKNDLNDAIKLRLLKEYELLGDLSPQKHLFKDYNIGGNYE